MNAIADGRAVLGIELGSTRIKACLIDPDTHRVLATGSHAWESRLVARLWSYPLEEVWAGVQAAYADLAGAVEAGEGSRPTRFAAIGVSGMMHGYLAFDAAGELLVPFRTWRNTNTTVAAERLTAEFGENIPLRWSIAHYYQAALDGETHVPEVAFLTTLAGYVHWRLTGERVLGVGDASGMFPIDAGTGAFDRALLARFDALLPETRGGSVAGLLPRVLPAGASAGVLTEAGARLIDPAGDLRPGVPLCPPEGDAGTGMVATGSVAPRTGNVSAGTSIFAMVVLERPLQRVHAEIDVVATPAGDPVAMVHCNNGANELGAWGAVFARFAEAIGADVTDDAVFAALFREALAGEPDAGGVVAYNFLAGEPIVDVAEGRPLMVREPGAAFTLANLMRAHVYGAFGALALGMRVLEEEHVEIDRMFAHGGVFRTAGVAQRMLAAALDTPVTVGETAAEGGAWGVAVLAAYLRAGGESSLGEYLAERVFRDAEVETRDPDPADVAGYARFLERYRAGLPAARVAGDHL